MSDASAALEAAIERYQAALTDTAILSLRVLAERARQQYSDAAEIEFTWSDQGDFLQYDSMYDAAGRDLDAYEFDGEGIDWNLGANCESVWAPYMLPPTRTVAGDKVYRLVIDTALALPIPGQS